MYEWKHQKIDLNFKSKWSIHGGSAKQKTNDFITVSFNGHNGSGEISSSTKNNDLKTITKDLSSINLNNLQSLEDIYNLQICPQVLAGLEMAWTHLQCKLQKKNIFNLLNIKPVNKAHTSFSIPILNEPETLNYIKQSNLSRFSSCKLKINGMSSLGSLKVVSNNYSGPIRLDANESFKSAQQVIEFLSLTKNMDIQFLEQPLHRTNLFEAKILKTKSTIPIIGDESLQGNDVSKEYSSLFHGLNIKLMKSGGYRQAIKQLNQCRKLGLKTMVGCMVETSLNISSALSISADCDWVDLDGHLLLKEDPFSLLDESNGVLSIK